MVQGNVSTAEYHGYKVKLIRITHEVMTLSTLT